jgi:hypothetical protein
MRVNGITARGVTRMIQVWQVEQNYGCGWETTGMEGEGLMGVHVDVCLTSRRKL